MKKIHTLTKVCAQVMIATAAFSAVSTAHACSKYDYVCKARDKARDLANRAKEEAERKAQQAAAAAQAAADRAAAEAKAAADRAAAEAARAAAEAKAAADKLAAGGAAISQSEMNTLASQAKSTYGATAGQVKSGYDQSVAKLQAVYDAALAALFKAAGNAAISNNRSTYTSMVNKFRNLDADGKAALNRVTRAISAQRIDEQVRKDMQLLATKMGMFAGQAGSNVPGNVARSSFGIQMTSASAAVIGSEQTYGIVMNTFLEDGKFKVGLTQSQGLSLGVQVGDSASIGLFWGPGSMEESDNGIAVGINFEVELVGGGGLGLSWGVEKGMSGAQNAIPGIAASLGVGGKVAIGTLSAGYTKLLAKM